MHADSILRSILSLARQAANGDFGLFAIHVLNAAPRQKSYLICSLFRQLGDAARKLAEGRKMRIATRTDKIIYWISTGYVLFAMMWSFVMYHVRHEFASAFFEMLGYPTYIVYPLAWLKLMAVIVILTNRYSDLKEWVYAAYFFNVLLATSGYINAGQLFPIHSYLALILLPVSYLYSNKVRGKPRRRLVNV